MKDYWTITYHNNNNLIEALVCVHKDMKNQYIFYRTMNYLPEFFASKYEIDFVMIMHMTKVVRIFMKEKGKGGTV